MMASAVSYRSKAIFIRDRTVGSRTGALMDRFYLTHVARPAFFCREKEHVRCETRLRTCRSASAGPGRRDYHRETRGFCRKTREISGTPSSPTPRLSVLRSKQSLSRGSKLPLTALVVVVLMLLVPWIWPLG
jgi:hypothetical protein